MNKKIPSKKIKGKYIYFSLKKVKNSNTLMVFMTGLSGGMTFPLFQNAEEYFSQLQYSVLRFNFCREENDERHPKNEIELNKYHFNLYTTELHNLLEKVPAKFDKIVFMGHSFGAIITLLFLEKFPKYKKVSRCVFWEPSNLPWSKKVMKNVYDFDEDTGLYKDRESAESINPTFFKEVTTVNSINLFKKIWIDACIICASGSQDKFGKKYFSNTKNKSKSLYHVIENTDHSFGGNKVQNELFKVTQKWLMMK